MTAKRFSVITIATALLFTGTSAMAYTGHGHKGHGRYHWDPDKVVSVTGEVTKVEVTTMKMHSGNYHGVHLELKTDKGVVEIHLGPEEYVNKQITIKKGDTLTVTGSKERYNDTTVIFAGTVTKDGKTVKLRDEDGIPAWAGSGHHGKRK